MRGMRDLSRLVRIQPRPVGQRFIVSQIDLLLPLPGPAEVVMNRGRRSDFTATSEICGCGSLRDASAIDDSHQQRRHPHSSLAHPAIVTLRELARTPSHPLIDAITSGIEPNTINTMSPGMRSHSIRWDRGVLM